MSETIETVVDWLDSRLESSDEAHRLSLSDISYNGLQFCPVPGMNVHKVLFSVDIGLSIINSAMRKDCNLIVVHHGLWWKNLSPNTPAFMARVSMLAKNNIALYASHLPLDYHPIVGNNRQIEKELGAQFVSIFNHVGVIAQFPRPMRKEYFNDLLRRTFGKSKFLDFGKDEISTIAICSGSAGYSGFWEFLSSGADAFITGDEFEVYEIARDEGVNVAFCGHYETEKFGIRALMEAFSMSRLSVDCEYQDRY